MLRRALTTIAILGALIAIFLARRPAQGYEPLINGRNNTVLVLTDSHHGLCNAHLAAVSALIERHPSVEVHYGSYPTLESKIGRIAENARAKRPEAKVHWHQFERPSIVDEIRSQKGGASGIRTPPGMLGLQAFADMLAFFIAAWSKEAHLKSYQRAVDIIQEVDPAIIILDPWFRPGIDAARNLNRRRAYVSPNALLDNLSRLQPRGAHFWKYPGSCSRLTPASIASGLPFPVPWRDILSNIYQQAYVVAKVLTSPNIRSKRSWLQEQGIKHAITLPEIERADIPWIAMSFPEAGLPLEYIPDNVHVAGPLVLDGAPAEAQSAELAGWLKKAPTMLINLGSAVSYDEQMARVMVDAIVPVLEAKGVQILWKMPKGGEYSDDFLEPARKYVENGRLRLESWLEVDPTSLYNTGDVVASVHHGGANCFYEAILAGLPSVVLPQWADHYRFARTAEYLGVGIWPCKATAPNWEAAGLTEAFIKVLSGETSVTMRQNAKALSQKGHEYGGDKTAAGLIAKLAAEGR
ncbi:glycosyltransferase family 1 [Trichoderma arundinaceum]|uniref:Glycosyltransferase family 1 n=1 Tax=Trichoderma arundinaceum TaxID=490622 RepID=A0A395NAB9_TRIAR|nr:glycosyltransferase family 1 [Trichoderma arundinaceum]